MKNATTDIVKLALAMVLLGMSALAGDNPESVGFAHSGPVDLRNPPSYYKLTPEEEEVLRHFLLADNPGELEHPREDWTEKVERRDALLMEIEAREGFSAAWDEAFLDAASWHYPKGGDLEAAQLYFRKKAEWMLRMLVSQEWFHDPVHLDAVAEFLGEIREWNFPAWVIVYPDQPGRDILQRAGVESPDDLPDEVQRAAYRKAVEDRDRMIALDRLHKALFHADIVARFGWWHCKQGLLIAEKNGDTEAVRRLEDVKKKIFANAEHPEALLRGTFADEPDCEEAIGAAPPPVWEK